MFGLKPKKPKPQNVYKKMKLCCDEPNLKTVQFVSQGQPTAAKKCMNCDMMFRFSQNLR